MTVLGLPDWFGKPLAVVVIDLLLAGDNALVIALVCQSMAPAQRRPVLVVGSLVAIVLRLVLTGVSGAVLAVPGLRLGGGVLLTLLALNLAVPSRQRAGAAPGIDGGSGVVAAALVVALVDVLMSLDNVLALAAVAGDSLVYLALGLLLSVSIIMFASTLVAYWLGRHPGLTRLGAALLGWVAGQLVMSDAWYGALVDAQAPALPLVVPVLLAAYVYLAPGQAVAAPMVERRVPAQRRMARPVPPPVPTVPEPPPIPVAAPPDTTAPAHEPAASEMPERLLLFGFLGVFLIAGLIIAGIAWLDGMNFSVRDSASLPPLLLK